MLPSRGVVNVLQFCHQLIVQGKCHHGRIGDIEQEGTEEAHGTELCGEGEDGGGEAAAVLDISLRHVRRLLAAYRRDGARS